MPPARPDGSPSLRMAPPVAPGTRPITVAPFTGRAADVVERRRWREAGHRPPVGRDRPRLEGRVTVDGKFFACGEQRFDFHGVSYGTFAPRPGDGAQFPERAVLARDLAAMRDHGFTVVRTYTAPSDDLLELARVNGLHVLAGLHYADWRGLIGTGRRQQAEMARAATAEIRRQAARLAGHDEVLAVVIGNEVPADAARWFGTRRIERVLGRLAETVHEVDDDVLVTYANYPTSEYLEVDGVDFLSYNVFLEDQDDLRRYLTRLHHLAGDRPLVLGECGIHTSDDDAGEVRQADAVDWQLATAVERGVAGTCLFTWTDEWWVGGGQVEGWRFGLTRRDRSPRPALDVAAAWNHRTVADLDDDWPSITVAICAYNSASTLDECLRHATRLDYPNLEILVVDDGSSDATAGIAFRHPRVKLVSIEHAGLSAARNACIANASGDLVAFLDSDAHPTPEWPYYLALGMDGPRVGGVGGPNVPPRDDPAGAHRVAASPGGPVHVLVANDRAEHVPGCNMAFWRSVLTEVGGFDPVYTAAGDDVDVCWKVLDRGWEIAFHPAALVWHHRRPTIGAYLRQQRGYGKAEALVAARHPDRFTAMGTARWRGRIYTSLAPSYRHQRIYRGAFAGAAFQSVYGAGGHAVDLAHQIGVPVALAATVGGLGIGLALWSPALLLTLVAVAFLLGLAAFDGATAKVPRSLGTLRFRATVGLLHLLQPLARWWGRWRHRVAAHEALGGSDALPAPVERRRRTTTFASTVSRPQLAGAVVERLRRAGVVVLPVTGWEDHDGRVAGSLLVGGELLTTGHADGIVQVRVRRYVRWPWVIGAAVAAGLLWFVAPAAGIAVASVALADGARGVYRTGLRIRRILWRPA
jgi:GT2 family glycosyltransferase